MAEPYFAHSTQRTDFSDWQPLAAHLRGVAAGARARAEQTKIPGLPEAASLAGLLHDLGKYRQEFQQYIRQVFGGPKELTYHKQAGAVKAAEWKQVPIAFAIFGHHGGLPDRTILEAGIKDPSVKKSIPLLWPNAAAELPELPELKIPQINVPKFKTSFSADLFTRLVFSCLVDADWADTSEHERVTNGWLADQTPPDLNPQDRLANVLAFIETRAQSCQDIQMKSVRKSILMACVDAAEKKPGIFTLTVPTGGGKTLAGLAFALKHAMHHDLRRVIYVAPYMSILEQNIKVFRDALGIAPDAIDVFEHYSLAEPQVAVSDDETTSHTTIRRAENWDAPIVITTNVQFFESLFSNNPGRCRKLHNIARSVIILDECQTLPPGIVAPTCAMLNQIANELGATLVLCTATQPAFGHESLSEEERIQACEIIPESLDLFTKLKRVQIRWPKKESQPLDWIEVAERMRRSASSPQTLCVVNTKKAAIAVFQELRHQDTPNLFHLSTAMCPAHRRDKLDSIRNLLKKRLPCYVVSTQLLEAGVDVDFPYVMRELAPLESIIQAAGRCNREGCIPHPGGLVEVFRSVDDAIPPDSWYRAGRDALLTQFLAREVWPQVDDPAVIQDYFHRLYYAGNLDAENIQSLRKTHQFKQINSLYHLIDNAGQPVVIRNWNCRQSVIEDMLMELRTRPRKSIFRALARFSVNLFPHQILKTAHLLHEEQCGLLVWDGVYDDNLGVIEEIAGEFVI